MISLVLEIEGGSWLQLFLARADQRQAGMGNVRDNERTLEDRHHWCCTSREVPAEMVVLV